MIQRRKLDLTVLLPTVGLVLIGLIAIYSATSVGEESNLQVKFTRQLIWASVGFMAMLFVSRISLKFIFQGTYWFYIISIALLVATLFIGSGSGASRWIVVGPISFQASELVKVTCLLTLARYLSSDNRNLSNIVELLIAFAIAFTPFVLVMKQPDLGSALVFLAMLLPMLHWAGLSTITLFVLVAPLFSLLCAFNYYSFFFAMATVCVVLYYTRKGVLFFLTNFLINISVGIITPIIWDLLKDYQKDRILTFLGVVQDPHGLGYQVIQSKVAIGSGGLWGKGFLQGTQTHLRFLPEQHTDFIFCVVGEEFGFVGAALTLILLFLVVSRGLTIAVLAKSRYAQLVAFGAASIFTFQIFVNIGMTIGLMPVTGLPLPFLSYGGSSLLSNLIIIGILLNLSLRRFEYL